jgi:hypothetical protein
MPQPNFEYKKALALGDKAFEALMTTKIVELVPDAKPPGRTIHYSLRPTIVTCRE